MSHGHARTVPADQAAIPKGSFWQKLPLIFGVIGVVALVLTWLVAQDDHGNRQFYYSYLTSFMFWLSLGLGGLFFVLIHHATRAGWSTVVRRIAENFMITLPLFVVLVIPIILLGTETLYAHWVHNEHAVHEAHAAGISLDAAAGVDAILVRKSWYLNTPFFILRGFVVTGLWTLFAVLFYRWSVRQDTTTDPVESAELSHKMRRWSPIGIALFALTLTIGAIDWIMSLDPHWYSTIFGVYYFAGTVMMVMAALALGAMALQKSGVLKDAITAEHYHDLGKLGFGFVVFWSYIAFSQFFLIWYANIPEETMWFGHRIEGGWDVMTLLLALLHFVIPFFFMMSRHIKRNRTMLTVGCILLLVAHLIDMFWLIQPNLSAAVAHDSGEHHLHLSFHIADLLALIGIGGLVLGVFCWRMGAAAAVPVNDPRLAESLSFENF